MSSDHGNLRDQIRRAESPFDAAKARLEKAITDNVPTSPFETMLMAETKNLTSLRRQEYSFPREVPGMGECMPIVGCGEDANFCARLNASISAFKGFGGPNPCGTSDARIIWDAPHSAPC